MRASGIIGFVGTLLVGSAVVAVENEPLTSSEMASFQQQIAPCWHVTPVRANAPVVTVGFELDRDGTPVKDSLRLIGAGKDTRSTVLEAYRVAKRAIIRCGAKGYKLPLEKFDQWKNIEVTFNPERTLLK